MTELIQRMSQVQVPDDLLRQVNMDGLIDDFRKNFKRLDDFKKTRSRHEDRNFLSKWWNSDELKNAQLDAVETQAAFSKAIGQLMVLSIVQSQRLQSQQEQLSSQQDVIKDQTQRIERHTLELHEQQELLAKQNTDLEKLVNDYFELRGLTQEGAKKLIAIANEVQSTRDSLLRSVEESLEGVSSQLDDALSLVDAKTSRLEAHVNHQTDVLAAHYGEVSASLQKNNLKWETKIEEFQQLTAHANELVVEFGSDLASQRAILNEFGAEIARQEETLDARSSAESAKIECVVKEFAAYRSQIESRFKKLYVGLGVGLLALGLAGSVVLVSTKF
jgi:hypothetical protein